MYYDEDFYNEPSEYDIMVDEFKQSLLKSVKREFLEEMNKLRKENKELQEIKKNWNDLQSEYRKKQYDLDISIETEKQKLYRMRLSELFEKCGMKTVLYHPCSAYIKKDKCDKCNETRQIIFLSPSGKRMTEMCKCATPYYVSYPQEHELVYFGRWVRDKKPLYVYFEDKSDDDCEKYSKKVVNLYKDQPFEKIYDEVGIDVYFEDVKKCLEYCLFINKKKKIPEELIEKYCVIDEEN